MLVSRGPRLIMLNLFQIGRRAEAIKFDTSSVSVVAVLLENILQSARKHLNGGIGLHKRGGQKV